MSSELTFNASDFPKDWEDDVRMNFLFTPFREKILNPEGWDAKMNFWMNTIQDLCLKSQSPLISLDSLCLALERKGKQPMCLDIVLDNMFRKGLIASMDDFNKVEGDKGWLGWGFDVLVQKPVSWGVSSVQSFLNWSKKDDRCVVLSVVKDVADKLLKHYYEQVESNWINSALFLENFQEECKNICSNQNFQLALIQLQKDKNAVVFEKYNTKIIKFRKPEEKKVQPLSQVEMANLSMRKARDTLLNDTNELEEKILSYTNSAKLLVKNGYKNKAMIALKKKKRLEVVLQEKIAALDNIENILYKLQNVGSEKMVLDAYKSGVQAMKSTTSNDLKLDDIDEVMSDVQGVMDDYIEIQRTLSKSVAVEDDNLEEFENELKDILSEEVKQSTKTFRESPPRVSDEDLLKRLAALRAPPEDVPPVKRSARSGSIKVPEHLL